MEVKSRRRSRNDTPKPLSVRIFLLPRTRGKGTNTVDVDDYFIRASHFQDKVDSIEVS